MLKIPVTSADHLQGDPGAAVVLVEYGDYQCPHCGRAYPIVKRVQAHFGKSLAFVFRNFPLAEMHPDAEAAAETAEFAATRDHFWEMHDAIFENQAELSPEMLLRLARELNLPVDDLRAALIDRTYRERVRQDFNGGVHSGVNGTPTFFINGSRHEGPLGFEDLVDAVNAQL